MTRTLKWKEGDGRIPCVVVTGGFGFIGSRFVKHILATTSYNVKIIDKMTYAADKERVFSGITAEDRWRVQFLKSDICDVSSISLSGCEYLVNFAAESHVDNSIEDGKPFIRSNIEGVFNLLECARKTPGLKKFVQISTDEVYGDMADIKGEPASDESFHLRPSSYYSASKASADLLVQACGRTFGIPYLITRTCNNFGPAQNEEKFLPTIFRSINEGKKVPVYGDGRQQREWIHIYDNVSIIAELMFSAAENEVYNIGSGYLYSNLKVIRKIGRALGKQVKYTHVKDRLGHDRLYKLDSKKVTDFLGERVFDSLESYLEYEVERAKDSSNGR